MLDRTSEQEVLEKELGIGIQLTTAIGGTRNLTLTAGVPLDWSEDKLNDTLDKLSKAGDRQKKKFDLEQTRNLLRNAEQTLLQHRNAITSQEIQYNAEWAKSTRKGPFQPTASQNGVMTGLQKNIENAQEHILQLRKTLAELEKECL